jgi:hypothetical protein
MLCDHGCDSIQSSDFGILDALARLCEVHQLMNGIEVLYNFDLERCRHYCTEITIKSTPEP